MITPYYSRDGIVIYCGDCLDVLPQLDGKFDTVMTDPPYGIDENHKKNATRGKLAKPRDYGSYDWDSARIPGFIPLAIQASKHQIIFGGNYYADLLPPSSGWIVWDKENTGDFSDCELIYTSFGRGCRIVRWMWNGFIRKGQEKRYHPTQKPLGVLLWIFHNYDVGNLIVDPFLGSGTTLVAAQREGRRATGIEISEDYCKIAVERLRQPTFWSIPIKAHQPQPVQLEAQL